MDLHPTPLLTHHEEQGFLREREHPVQPHLVLNVLQNPNNLLKSLKKASPRTSPRARTKGRTDQLLVIVPGFLIRSAMGRSPSSTRMTTSCGMVETVIEVGIVMSSIWNKFFPTLK